MGERGVERAELDSQRDADRCLDAGDQVEIGRLDIGCRAPWIGGHPVEVQLEGVRASILNPVGIANPAAYRRRVEAGYDRDSGLLLDSFEPVEIALGRALEPVDRREIVQRFREMFGALLEGPIELELLGDDLLLEQRRQDDRANPGSLEPCGYCRFTVVGRRRGDNRRAEVQSEIAGSQVDRHARSPASS